jgi:hypothetical protein
MSLHRDIPEDIISTILSHLCHDHSTLRTCAIAASTFLFSSQRHLFSNINVSKGSRQCQKFHSLISSSPHLSVHVRHLSIRDFPEGNLGWIMSEPTLPLVLRALSFLRSFYLDCARPDDRDMAVSWHMLPKELESSLLRVLQLPSLEGVEYRALNIPISIFIHSPQLKRLRLPGCFLNRDRLQPLQSSNKIHIEQLVITAETHSNGLIDSLSFVFGLSRLRELRILGPNAEMLKAAGDVTELSALSLERFQWTLPYFYNATGVYLKVLKSKLLTHPVQQVI